MNPAPHPAKSAGSPDRREGWGIYAAEIWVLLSAWCSLTGWALSLCGRLDATGYAASFLIGGTLLFLWIRHTGIPAATPWKHLPALWHKRFAKPLPFLFLAAALLSLVGGALYAPTNYDALTYRLPRLYHWLAEGRWHWIDTYNNRMNYSGVAFEWLMAPLLLFTRGDRFLFLINLLPWLLLPGVTFACLRAMGVRPRVAWYWMWLFPMAHCCLIQAGSIGNDSYAVLYILLSVGLALRAQHTRRAGSLWIATLAAALCTGSKASNLPLLLPFAIAAWPAARQLIPARKTAALIVCATCLAVSFLPLAVLNQLHTGKWTGDPRNTGKMELTNPVAAFTGNAIQLAIHNLESPVLASAFNGVTDRLTHTRFIQGIMKSYPRFGLSTGEIPVEESAGEGIGITLLFLISLAAWPWAHRAPAPAVRNADNGEKTTHAILITLGAWIALAVYMAKIGSEAAPRLVAAYYPLCFAIALLHPGNALLVRHRWWRTAATLATLSIFPALILSPARPLWPATTLLPALAASHPQNPFVQRANTVYQVYSHRDGVFAPLTRHIPPGTPAIAFLGNGDEPSASLWLPFGGRRVFDFFPGGENRVFSHYPKILLLVSRAGINVQYGETAEDWIAEHHARIIAQEKIIVKVHRGAPEDWFLLELQAPWGSPPMKTRKITRRPPFTPLPPFGIRRPCATPSI